MRRHGEDGQVCGPFEDVQGLVLASFGSQKLPPGPVRLGELARGALLREELYCGAVGALGQIDVSQTLEHLRERAPGMTYVNSGSALEHRQRLQRIFPRGVGLVELEFEPGALRGQGAELARARFVPEQLLCPLEVLARHLSALLVQEDHGTKLV